MMRATSLQLEWPVREALGHCRARNRDAAKSGDLALLKPDSDMRSGAASSLSYLGRNRAIVKIEDPLLKASSQQQLVHRRDVRRDGQVTVVAVQRWIGDDGTDKREHRRRYAHWLHKENGARLDKLIRSNSATGIEDINPLPIRRKACRQEVRHSNSITVDSSKVLVNMITDRHKRDVELPSPPPTRRGHHSKPSTRRLRIRKEDIMLKLSGP